MENALALPWYWKVFGALGGVSLLAHFVSEGIPRAVAFLLPFVIKLVDLAFAWIASHPSARAAAVHYRPQIEDFVKKIGDALKSIWDAAVQEGKKDLDAADATPAK